jgi:class 3 adenylate cyclase/tetratricopeptide (TPR) repeat protein
VTTSATAPDGDAREAVVAAIRRRLARGAPWDACDAFREGVVGHAGDAELLYWGALAHARAGAVQEALAWLDKAQAAAQDPGLVVEILSLRGRLWKDRLHRARDDGAAVAAAERARAEYMAAFRLRRDPYPGINAATLSLLLGDRATATDLAREIAGSLAARTAPLTPWDHATAGEAALLLGRFAQARECYSAAYDAAPGDAGSVASMRRQAGLLTRVLPEAAGVLRVLPVPDVLAFSGHMIDAADRSEIRFPAALAPAVSAAIRQRLAGLHQPVIYTSAACGADLLCIEAALDIGAEVNVVLPFARDDFVRTSVAIGGEGWLGRFDAALARVARVIPATDESYLGDDVLFDHAAWLLEGLAALRAAQLQTVPVLLCVIDAAAPGGVGGTLSAFRRWQRHFGAPQVIDLRALRTKSAPAVPTEDSGDPARPAAEAGAPSPSALSAMPDVAGRPRRTLKALLFADFAGYSRLHDAFAPLFQARFWQIAAEQLESSPVRPLAANTWGDALYVVFESAPEAAEFALRFLARMLDVDWTAAGLTDTSQIRIALHAGPVFCGFDPIIGRDNYFGSGVTKAARIEPVTPPGMVYASEAFAASLAATGQDDFALEYVGLLPLAKGYGESRIYRLDRR